MHVVLVSQSSGRALQRTRSIIDRFAVRFGTDTWMTPITMEALAGLRKDLAQAASREMSVACYRNSGMQKMTLLWTVGSRKLFGEHGGVAVAIQSRKPGAISEYVRTVMTLAKLSGFTHDLGKMNAFFQEKLRWPETGKLGDPVRHEWLSGILLETVWKGEPTNLEKAARLGSAPLSFAAQTKQTGARWSALEALRWAIVTHHRMLGGSLDQATEERHWTVSGYNVKDRVDIPKGNRGLKLLASFKKERVFQKFQDAPLPNRVLQRIQEVRDSLLQNPVDDWRGSAIIARAALTWADHYYSAQPQANPDDGEVLRANTKAQQSLKNHLFGVGGHASRIARAFFEGQDFPGSSPQSVENIAHPADPASRFRWQNTSADFLGNLPEGRPTLVFNLGGTGSGKTRANMRCLAAMVQEDQPFRVTSVFNLRTLTVQTHRAYQHELGIEESDLACIVGDPLVKKLNDIEQAVALEDDDLFRAEDETEYQVEGAAAGAVPTWLERMRSFDSGLIPLLTPPILVATIDYVIAAGDFGDMRHHSSALMRIAHSDLILDEIDGYEPAALVSVCRVVLMAALFGRNVVASSATLSEPVAMALRQAFAQGCAMRSGMIGEPVSPQYAFVDDRVAPSVAGENDFDAVYHRHVENLVAAVSTSTAHRRYCGIMVDSGNLADWAGVVDTESMRLHTDHHFEWDGVRVSVGLVRLANVRPCVQMSRILADRNDDGLMVTSYHASDMKLRRAMKEQRLDRVLTRKPKKGGHANQSIMEDPEMRQAHARAKASGARDLRFVVVATPVEEIGRDHDFDWAILEPSSAQSIVQAAGRVNRHRLLIVEHPNVAVFDRNLRSFKPEDGKSFRYPGYEVDQVDVYPHHDMGSLLDKEEGATIHAGWRIGSSRTPFARCDDTAIHAFLKDGMKYLDSPWMWQSALFKKYALRTKSGMYAHTFRYDKDDRQMWALQQNKEESYKEGYETCGNVSTHAFFCPSADAVVQYAQEINEDEKMAQRFPVTMPKERKPIHFDLQFGGYRIPCKK